MSLSVNARCRMGMRQCKSSTTERAQRRRDRDRETEPTDKEIDARQTDRTTDGWETETERKRNTERKRLRQTMRQTDHRDWYRNWVAQRHKESDKENTPNTKGSHLNGCKRNKSYSTMHTQYSSHWSWSVENEPSGNSVTKSYAEANIIILSFSLDFY